MEIGIKGISYSATERKYLVRVIKDSKRVYVGRYSSLEEAKEALESYADAPKTQSTTPILESLRATFAPKKTKTSSHKTKSSKSKSLEPVKILTKTIKVTNDVAPKRPSKAGSLTREEFNATGLQMIMDVDSVNHAAAENNLRIILKYLIREADKRGTSVFDVVVQEVAKLSK